MFLKKKKKEEQFKKVEPSEEVVDKNPIDELVKETKSKQEEETKSGQEEETKSKQEEKREFRVVKELPLQPVREAKAEDGTIITYVTIEEALTEFMNSEE